MLNRLLTVLLTIACILVVVRIVDIYTGDRLSAFLRDRRAPKPVAEEIVKAVRSSSGSPMLVALMSSRCQACARDLPLYKRLGASARLGLTLPIAFVFPVGDANADEMLARYSIEAATYYADFARLGIRATPTLVLIDKRGEVAYLWVGSQADAENALFRWLEEWIAVPGRIGTRAD